MELRSFTPKEMEEVADVLREAFLAVFQNLDPEHQTAITDFWKNHLKTSRPTMMVTEQGLVDYSRSVFGNDLRRDFVMQFTSTFFFMWGADNDTRLALMKNLAHTVSADLGVYLVKPSMVRGMPKENAARLKEVPDAIEVLSSNSWLAVMIMSTMFMTYRMFEKDVKSNKKGNAA
jgi:hypothetical protein